MAVSCSFLPNHDPGDDVFKFELRLPPDVDNPCFCLKGQACEDPDNPEPTISAGCADTEVMVKRFFAMGKIYAFFLEPLTAWDASRFLNLAVHPATRDPTQRTRKESQDECGTNQLCDSCQALFLPSEQAHAFFPMLPIVIRAISNFLMAIIPQTILPPTYEGVATLSALLWNMFCFLLAALALYDLTLGLTQHHIKNAVSPNEKRFRRKCCHHISYRVFLLFCINPASVFFTAAYSESTFAMCNFVGHAILVRALVTNRNRSFGSLLLCLVAVPFWMAASYTRSNGSINTAWLVLQGLGFASYWPPKVNQIKGICSLLICTLVGLTVAFPIYWHDSEGYDRHCRLEGYDLATPSWCSINNASFSLYRHVQQKHWNVGIFRYYTAKKIPNFLLAAPILFLSVLAVIDWIHISWKKIQYSGHNQGNVVDWAVSSLAASVGWLDSGTRKGGVNNQSGNDLALEISEHLLLGPLMLGHYAVLAAVCAVGILVAHIEIATRMVCSSCPAIYWFMALCSVAATETNDRIIKLSKIRYYVRGLLLPYSFLYITLGVVMHPNWLPWT